jgi:DNA ligase (NAD+)
MMNRIISYGFGFFYFYCIFVYEVFASTGIFRPWSHTCVCYSRFIPITSTSLISDSKNPLRERYGITQTEHAKLLAFSHKMTSALSLPTAELWHPGLPLEKKETNDYDKNWYPWMLLKCDPVSLNTLSGFICPNPPISDLAYPKRSQKNYRYLEPTYVPTTFESENIKKWIAVCNEELKNYREGRGRLPRFFYDLLHRKVQSILKNLSEADCSIYPLLDVEKEPEKTFEAYSLLELLAYFYNVNKALGPFDERKFVYYPVPNGIPISAVYENGVLKEVYTNAFGDRRDLLDVMSTVKIPQTIVNNKPIKLGGYLYLDSAAMEFINAERRGQGQRDFVDAYSAVAEALLQTSEPNRALELKLKCIFDELEYLNEETTLSKKEQLLQINKEHLPSFDDKLVVVGNSKLGLVYPLSNKYLPYESLGCKVTLNNTDEKKLVALSDAIVKFAPETKKTKIESIKFEVLDNGCILSTIHTTPVTFGEETYTMFTLSNESELISLNLQVDDDIDVMKIQGAAPRIYRSFATGGKDFARYPKECPQCLNPLSRKLNGSEIINFCAAHLQCKDETMAEIMRFSSVHGLHIPSLTEHLIKELKRKSKAFNYLDLMDLPMGGYSALDGINRDIYDRLVDEIRAAKQTTLPRLLYALNIPGVDFVVAEKLANKFGSLLRIGQATVSEISSDNMVAPEQAIEMREWFKNPISQRKIKRLFERGVKISEPSKEILELCYKSDYKKIDYTEIVKKINEYTTTHEISDLEYDKLCQVADVIEAQYPKWVTKRSDKLAISDKSSLKPIFSKEPVEYIGKTYEVNEIINLIAKLRERAGVNDDKLELIVEPKVDGVACFLQYENGQLVAAYTKKANRGNNITDLAVKIPSIPKKLKVRFSGIVRGELFITNENFSLINEGIIQEGKEGYVDSLSLLVGVINSKDETRSSILSSMEIFPFWMEPIDSAQKLNSDITPQNVHKQLASLGFAHSIKKSFQIFKTINEIKDYVNNAAERRFEQPSNIDGMVIKVAVSKKCLAFAYKFNRETRSSTLESVDFTITKNRRIQAVANLTPINFGKRKVSRVYIHNPLLLNGIRKGDVVSIHYAAGSAPIFDKIEKQSSKKTKMPEISLPHSCPVCSTKLTNLNGYLWCKNSRCGGNQKKESDLINFVQQMNMISLSAPKAWYRELIEKGVVNTIGDFFRITSDEIASITSLSIENAQILLTNIARASSADPSYLFNRTIPGLKVSKECFSRLLERVAEPKMLLEQSLQELVAHGLTIKQARIFYEYSQKNKNDLICILEYIKHNPAINTSSYSITEAREKLMKEFQNRATASDKVIAGLSEDLKRIIDTNKKEYPLLIATTPTDLADKVVFRDFLNIIGRYIKASERLLKEVEINAAITEKLHDVTRRTERYMVLKSKQPRLDNEDDDFSELDFSDSSSEEISDENEN